MEPFTVLALVLGGYSLLKKKTSAPPMPRTEVTGLIIDAARAANVPVIVALAFADLESALNPRAQGDLGWPTRKGGALYQEKVLDEPRLSQNPARGDRLAWHSYGLFQLLAAAHVLPLEHPNALLDPRINAARGCAFIGTLLKRSNGDVVKARLAYLGCGMDGARCSPEIVTQATTRLHAAIAKWTSATKAGLA